VGVEAIAEAAGVTKKTLYDQYGSKEALVAAYLTVRDNSYRRWVTSRVCDHSDDGVRRLLAIFDALDEWMGRQPRRGCAFINAFAELPESGHSGRDIAIAQKTWLRGYFAELATDAGLPQPEVLADQLLTLHEGAIISYSAGGQDYAAATAKEAASILIAALGAPIDKTYGGSWSPPAVTNG
jgi:AcrR family transcriptional regulator